MKKIIVHVICSVPIIPEYLLRMEHPNETDILFSHNSQKRVKRQVCSTGRVREIEIK